MIKMTTVTTTTERTTKTNNNKYKNNKSSSGDEIPERDVTSVYLLRNHCTINRMTHSLPEHFSNTYL